MPLDKHPWMAARLAELGITEAYTLEDLKAALAKSKLKAQEPKRVSEDDRRMFKLLTQYEPTWSKPIRFLPQAFHNPK